MTTSERWTRAISEACAEAQPALSNRAITQVHHGLSEALAHHLGRSGGPNFHTWAVWGSRKAGVTIRQEDLDSAIRNATVTAGIVGGIVGATAGLSSGRLLQILTNPINAMIGTSLGAVAGGWTGRRIAIWSREKAASLVLAGNKTVLVDIGTQSARFLELLESGASSDDRRTFFAGLRPGPTEIQGQDRLATAFHSYLVALDSTDPTIRREAMIAGNCEIVYHEHIRLEPYIRGAMPFIIRRCATDRLMSYEIGEKILKVGEDLPDSQTSTAARDWTRIEERMRYVFSLFRSQHDTPEVFSKPY
jgi:hypothetical protein